MKPIKAVIEIDCTDYGTVQAEKLLRIFIRFIKEYTTYKGHIRGYIQYDGRD
jgi:hypothetical protein